MAETCNLIGVLCPKCPEGILRYLPEEVLSDTVVHKSKCNCCGYTEEHRYPPEPIRHRIVKRIPLKKGREHIVTRYEEDPTVLVHSHGRFGNHLITQKYQKGGLMVLLFKLEHIGPILHGEKTQTRRAWKRYCAKLEMLSRDYFALLRITGASKNALVTSPRSALGPRPTAPSRTAVRSGSG